MGGRKDYEERKEARKIRYEELAKKAEERSSQYMNSKANKILQMTPGQPIIIGHHSEKKARRLHEKAWEDIRKSIQEDKKKDYYNDRIKTINNSSVIYGDDPNAIEKLKSKLESLQREKELVKADPKHTSFQLDNYNASIRETKRRIKRLEELENIEFKDIEFNGGKATHNKEINRIQIFFDEIPNEEIRKELKSNGFHWSRYEGAWQRQYTQNTIKATDRLIRDVLSRVETEEDEEEEEFE